MTAMSTGELVQQQAEADAGERHVADAVADQASRRWTR